MDEPTVADVLNMLDRFGAEYGDVVRRLYENQKVTKIPKIGTVKFTKPKGWTPEPPHVVKYHRYTLDTHPWLADLLDNKPEGTVVTREFRGNGTRWSVERTASSLGIKVGRVRYRNA